MPLKVITVKLEEEMLEKIDTIAKKRRMSRSDLIREAILKFLNRT